MKCLKLVADRPLQQLTPNRLTPTLSPKPIPNSHMTRLTLTLPCIMISLFLLHKQCAVRNRK